MTVHSLHNDNPDDNDDDEGQLLHVHDLPQLYIRPSYETLCSTLDLLRRQPPTFFFSSSPQSDSSTNSPKVTVAEEGVPRYLTAIISSGLSWLPSDTAREHIWATASTRLSERAGRNAMPSMTRAFLIDDDLTIELFEPSLTGDNLGLKTWTSSLLLARRLRALASHVPSGCDRVLELGAGTGLVGIAAAKVWEVDVVLTDLEAIVPNLRRNVEANMELFEGGKERCLEARTLDWADVSHSPQDEEEKFSVVVAADPIYSFDHPGMLVEAVSRWIQRRDVSRFIVELPLREGYERERKDLRERLAQADMVLLEEGTEVGYDDWQGADGRPAEVECWWSIWCLSARGLSTKVDQPDPS